MKILVVTQYFWPEQFRINDLCNALIERGHEVTVYTGLPNYPEGNFFKGYSFKGPYNEYYGKIKVIRTPLIPRGNKKSLQLIANYFSFCIISTLLAPFLLRDKYDKIFIYQLSPVFSAIPAIFIKKLKSIPVIMWVTDLWPESLSATGVLKNKKTLSLIQKIVNWIYQNSDIIYISSEGFKNKITANGIDVKKIKYWPQWAEALFDRKVTEEELSALDLPNGFIVMFAGNIGTAQDFESIIEAANILKEEKRIHFVILGDGLMKNWAEIKTKEIGINSNFHFLGRKPVEQMPLYYKKADVMLVSLTDTELFSITIPSKIQSYLAAGKPVLASLNGEGAKIIEKWCAGKSCPASNPLELANTILLMSKLNKDELQKLGNNALKCYKEEFEREKLMSILISDFQKLN